MRNFSHSAVVVTIVTTAQPGRGHHCGVHRASKLRACTVAHELGPGGAVTNTWSGRAAPESRKKGCTMGSQGSQGSQQESSSSGHLRSARLDGPIHIAGQRTGRGPDSLAGGGRAAGAARLVAGFGSAVAAAHRRTGLQRALAHAALLARFALVALGRRGLPLGLPLGPDLRRLGQLGGLARGAAPPCLALPWLALLDTRTGGQPHSLDRSARTPRLACTPARAERGVVHSW